MKKIIFVYLLLSNLIYTTNLVRVIPQRASDDGSHSYFIDLLQLALDKSSHIYGDATVFVTDFEGSQDRVLFQMQHNRDIDVHWVGTSIDREERLEAIRIPLIGGLLGYRIPVIRAEDKRRFNNIHTLEDLRAFTAIQGDQWPDSDILESAGLKVMRTPKFSNMYPMLINRRADYFPRAISEVYAEVRALNRDDIIIYDNLIIAYKFPMYFFTSKDNIHLNNQIREGLVMAIEDGSFLEFIKNHHVTRDIFPTSQYKDSRIIYIDNPFLPEYTPINNEKLWIRF